MTADPAVGGRSTPRRAEAHERAGVTRIAPTQGQIRPVARAGSGVAKPTPLALAALALGALCLVLGRSGSLDSRLWASALGAATIGIGCFVVVGGSARSEIGPRLIQLGPATIVLYTLSFGVFGLAWLVPQSGGRQVIDATEVPGAIALSMVGLVFLTIGYVVGPPAAFVRASRQVVARVLPLGQWSLRVPSIAVLLYVVGTAARALRLSSGQYGYLQDASQSLASPSSTGQLLSLVEELTTVALVVAAIDCFILRRSARSRVVLVCIATLEIIIGLGSASKQSVLFTLVAIAMVRAFSGRRVPLWVILTAALMVSLLFPFNSQYRTVLRHGKAGQIAPSTALAALPGVLQSTWDHASVRSVLMDGPSAVARRVRQVDNVALVMQKTPASIAYVPWTQLFTGPAVAAVPRAFWAAKPVLSSGREFAQVYYELPPTVYSANAVTIPGDLYRHGGLVPLLLGMAGFGLLLRLFQNTIWPTVDARLILMYVPVFLYLVKLESDVTTFVTGLLQLVLFLCLCSWLVFRSAGFDRNITSRIDGSSYLKGR